MKIMLYRKLHCQKVSKLKLFSYDSEPSTLKQVVQLASGGANGSKSTGAGESGGFLVAAASEI